MRWTKYKYLMLLRAKGGPAIVARGFSFGLAVEMFTLPTFGLAFFLIFPLVYFFRASFAGALGGFVFGKIIYLPVFFLAIQRIGDLITPSQIEQYIPYLPGWLVRLLNVYLQAILGGAVTGAILGLIAYFPVKLLLQGYASRRRERRKLRKSKLLVRGEVGNPGDGLK